MDCEEGKVKPSVSGATACIECGEREVPSLDQTRCTASVVCPDGKFLSTDGYCKDCDNTFSFLYVVGSLLSFVLLSYYVAKMASLRHQMVRVKVLSTFYQCAQLTTSVKIPWPSFALFAIPFSLPLTDSKCLATGTGWNQVRSCKLT